ncbi:MAG: ABC transporter permease [Acidobacteria bacterium]|nr:ABC transporter permease [Acidobacteriota bacterium]
MTLDGLVRRNIVHFWPTNLAVVVGVAVAVAVLAGALLVGSSVRSSLRVLALERLGAIDQVVTSLGFVREELAGELMQAEGMGSAFGGAAPIVAVEGFVTHQASGRRASGIQVYGVDHRFWEFHGLDAAPRELGRNDVLVSEGLADELGAADGDALLVRVEKPSDVPISSLHGRRDDVGRTLRLGVNRVLPPAELGEFSFRPQQGLARSVFVSLGRLQRDLEQEGRVNTLLLAAVAGSSEAPAAAAARLATAEAAVRTAATLDDLGLRARALPAHDAVSIESAAGLLNDETVAAAESVAGTLGLRVEPVLTYLANALRVGDRLTPYSLVTARALDVVSDVASRASAGTQDEAVGVTGETGSAVGETGTAGVGAGAAADEAGGAGEADAAAPMVLNRWAADDLEASAGDTLTLEYYVWEDEGRLATHEAAFRIADVVPIAGAADDRDLAPDYPGITEATDVTDWDPPFDIDLDLIRPADEEYWDDHRTTPKAFIPLAVGQRLWGSRWGEVTSIRLHPAAAGVPGGASAPGSVVAPAGTGAPAGTAAPGADVEALAADLRGAFRSALDPLAIGFVVYPARALAVEASAGVTDFGLYFIYFSFFLVVSALLLASLFFRLGVEQRLREIGLLRAAGYPAAAIRRVFLSEAFVLAAAGSAVGVLGAIGYAELVMWGLRTWWVDAVGTTRLALAVSPAMLAAGAAGGVLAAFGSIGWTLRALAPASPRSLLTGAVAEVTGLPAASESEAPPPGARAWRIGLGLLGGGAAAVGLASAGLIGATEGFFGGGLLLLVAMLVFAWAWIGGRPSAAVHEQWSVPRVGFRNASYRPGRSVLCIALIASAAFIIVAVDAFRREGGGNVLDRASGTGGYTLLADTLLPIVHDPSTVEGQDELFVADLFEEGEALAGVTLERFRLRPGEDASCLNLYQAKDPRVLAPTPAFVAEGRFAFGATAAETPEEEANPWLLLDREFADGAIPAIADSTSLNYALHIGIGDDFVLNRDTDRPITLRIVGALSDSIFQRELLISESHFERVFPDYDGYRFFLIDAPPARMADVSAALEDRLVDFGFDVVSAGERLAAFHRVENTYLATFQTLGGLGLILGTFGLGAVLLRNVLERRRELALMRAVGYNARHLSLMVLAENAFLLFAGLAAGTGCAIVAIAPAWLERGGGVPLLSLGGLLLVVVATGLTASLAATVAAVRSPLLGALRAE